MGRQTVGLVSFRVAAISTLESMMIMLGFLDFMDYSVAVLMPIMCLFSFSETVGESVRQAYYIFAGIFLGSLGSMLSYYIGGWYNPAIDICLACICVFVLGANENFFVSRFGLVCLIIGLNATLVSERQLDPNKHNYRFGILEDKDSLRYLTLLQFTVSAFINLIVCFLGSLVFIGPVFTSSVLFNNTAYLLEICEGYFSQLHDIINRNGQYDPEISESSVENRKRADSGWSQRRLQGNGDHRRQPENYMKTSISSASRAAYSFSDSDNLEDGKDSDEEGQSETIVNMRGNPHSTRLSFVEAPKSPAARRAREKRVRSFSSPKWRGSQLNGPRMEGLVVCGSESRVRVDSEASGADTDQLTDGCTTGILSGDVSTTSVGMRYIFSNRKARSHKELDQLFLSELVGIDVLIPNTEYEVWRAHLGDFLYAIKERLALIGLRLQMLRGLVLEDVTEEMWMLGFKPLVGRFNAILAEVQYFLRIDMSMLRGIDPLLQDHEDKVLIDALDEAVVDVAKSITVEVQTRIKSGRKVYPMEDAIIFQVYLNTLTEIVKDLVHLRTRIKNISILNYGNFLTAENEHKEGEEAKKESRIKWAVKHCKAIGSHSAYIFMDGFVHGFKPILNFESGLSGKLASETFRMAVRLVLGCGFLFIALYFLRDYYQFSFVWTIITFVIVVVSTVGATLSRIGQRIVGTVLGAYLAQFVTFISVDKVWIAIVLIVYLTSIIYVQKTYKYSYFGAVSGFTFILILISEVEGGEDDLLPSYRAMNIAIGSVYAAIVSYLILPTSATVILKTMLSVQMKNVGKVIVDIIVSKIYTEPSKEFCDDISKQISTIFRSSNQAQLLLEPCRHEVNYRMLSPAVSGHINLCINHLHRYSHILLLIHSLTSHTFDKPLVREFALPVKNALEVCLIQGKQFLEEQSRWISEGTVESNVALGIDLEEYKDEIVLQYQKMRKRLLTTETFGSLHRDYTRLTSCYYLVFLYIEDVIVLRDEVLALSSPALHSADTDT
eukprot:Nk52_evm11s230 gene=Nk52_evmTU11s230